MNVIKKRSELKVRRPLIKDLIEIEKIAQSYNSHPLPDKFDSAAVVENGKIIAFGITRSNCELLFYCSGSLRNRVESLKQILEQGKTDAKALGYNDIMVYAQDREFANILIKHFQFREAKGIALILDL